jgi:hypothetical protein
MQIILYAYGYIENIEIPTKCENFVIFISASKN